MFSQDRHLLALEPSVFTQINWPQQTLAVGTANIAGTTLTAGGVNFQTVGVKPGHVIVLEGTTPYEIVAVLSPLTLTVSLVRLSPEDPPLPLPTMTAVSYRIATFDPQHAALERVLLARLEVSAEAAQELEEQDTLALASACGVLAALYRAVSSGSVNPKTNAVSDDWATIKARLYETYFRAILRLVRSVPALRRG